MKIKGVPLLAVVPILAGCVPWPHRVTTAPQINGRIFKDGRPVQGLEVELAEDMPTAGNVARGSRLAKAVSDPDGRFRIGPITRFSWFVHVPIFGVEDPAATWGMRISEHGRSSIWRAGWIADRLHIGFAPSSPLEAQCDLDSKELRSDIRNGYVTGNGLCQLVSTGTRE